MSKLLKALLLIPLGWFQPGIGTIASIVGIGAGLNSMGAFGGGGGGGGGGNIGMRTGDYDWAWGDSIDRNRNQAVALSRTADPILSSILSNRMGTDYSSLLALAPQIQELYRGMAAMDPRYATALSDAGFGQIGAGNQLLTGGLSTLNTAMDPMGNAKADLWQQVLQATRGADAARGIIMSPHSAGVESRAATDFNTTWDMNNLQRQLMGIQGLSSAIGGAGNAFGSGANLFDASRGFTQAGVDDAIAGEMTPQMLQEIVNANKMKGLSEYSSGVMNFQIAPEQALRQEILDYLGIGNSAQQVANNQFNADRQFDASQQGGGAYALAQGLSGLSKRYPNAFNFTGSGGGSPTPGATSSWVAPNSWGAPAGA